MELFKPNSGLVFWMFFVFVVFLPYLQNTHGLILFGVLMIGLILSTKESNMLKMQKLN